MNWLRAWSKCGSVRCIYRYVSGLGQFFRWFRGLFLVAVFVLTFLCFVAAVSGVGSDGDANENADAVFGELSVTYTSNRLT